MTNLDDLKKKLDGLVAESRQQRLKRQNDRASGMGDLNDRLDRFQARAAAWIETGVLPRLRAIEEALPSERTTLIERRGLTARFHRDSDPAFLVSVEFTIRFAYDPDRRRIRASSQTRIIPILMEFDEKGTVEFDADDAVDATVSAFIEDRVCRFVSDYLRIEDPDSRYQTGRQVSDPVCGMTFHPSEAIGSLDHGSHTYYFCADECRQRFASDPNRYVGGR